MIVTRTLRVVILTSASLIALSPMSHGEDAKDSAVDRIKVIRASYEKLPPTILGIKEPIEVKQCQKQKFPVCFNLTFTDANGTHHYFNWWLEKERYGNAEFDRIEWVPYTGTAFIKPKGSKRFRLAIRGSEEAALYGLLLRWASDKEKAKTLSSLDESLLKEVKVSLEKLDDRFAEKPTEVK